MHTLTQTPTPTSLIPAAFDPDGFLADPSVWTHNLAAQIAEFDGLAPLTDSHWKVIQHVRERFFRVGGLPVMRLVCRATGVPRAEIRRLFGDCRTIWRIAGLPNPGEEAKAYF